MNQGWFTVPSLYFGGGGCANRHAFMQYECGQFQQPDGITTHLGMAFVHQWIHSCTHSSIYCAAACPIPLLSLKKEGRDRESTETSISNGTMMMMMMVQQQQCWHSFFGILLLRCSSVFFWCCLAPKLPPPPPQARVLSLSVGSVCLSVCHSLTHSLTHSFTPQQQHKECLTSFRPPIPKLTYF